MDASRLSDGELPDEAGALQQAIARAEIAESLARRWEDAVVPYVSGSHEEWVKPEEAALRLDRHFGHTEAVLAECLEALRRARTDLGNCSTAFRLAGMGAAMELASIARDEIDAILARHGARVAAPDEAEMLTKAEAQDAALTASEEAFFAEYRRRKAAGTLDDPPTTEADNG